jgi:hypothetical protein
MDTTLSEAVRKAIVEGCAAAAAHDIGTLPTAAYVDMVRAIEAEIKRAVLDEREACAKVAEGAAKWPGLDAVPRYVMARDIAAEIRTRK